MHRIGIELKKLHEQIRSLTQDVRGPTLLTIANTILLEVRKMSVDFAKLLSSVEKQKTVEASVITLLSTLSAQIKTLTDQLTNAAGDAVATVQAQLTSVADQLDTQTQSLADAVAANTVPTPPVTTPANTPANVPETPAAASASKK